MKQRKNRKETDETLQYIVQLLGEKNLEILREVQGEDFKDLLNKKYGKLCLRRSICETGESIFFIFDKTKNIFENHKERLLEIKYFHENFEFLFISRREIFFQKCIRILNWIWKALMLLIPVVVSKIIELYRK